MKYAQHYSLGDNQMGKRYRVNINQKLIFESHCVISADFSFMGSYILEEVIKDLMSHGLNMADKLILAGSR